MLVDIKAYKNAKQARVLKERKTFNVLDNGRSTDFIMPGFATGCDLSCSYCFVARHRAMGNPIEQYTNLRTIWKETEKHFKKLPLKKEPNQCDPYYWTYDIAENTDALLPRNINTTNIFIEAFMRGSNVKPSFATKISNSTKLIDVNQYNEKGKPRRARVRASLMPQRISTIVEVGTSPIESRIRNLNSMYLKGYEVHINFSPIILTKAWLQDYKELFKLIDSILLPEVKEQLKCECIFLTHSEKLHNSNLTWNAKAEPYLWNPNVQELKTTQRGDSSVVRYKALTIKKKAIEDFRTHLATYLPYCKIRYIF
jgi:spore photoproduct lyase